MVKLTKKVAMFNSYVKLPEGCRGEAPGSSAAMAIDAQLLGPASVGRESPAVLLGRLSWHGAGRREAGEVVEMPGFDGTETGTPISGRQQHHPQAGAPSRSRAAGGRG